MKPLGWEAMVHFRYEDRGDIQNYGSPSRTSRLPSKNGDTKNSFRNPLKKAEARRIWKRKNRQKAKQKIRKELHSSLY